VSAHILPQVIDMYCDVQALTRSDIGAISRIAVVPLGSSNDISRSVGWRSFKEEYWQDDAIPGILSGVAGGVPVAVDNWKVRVSADKNKTVLGASQLPASFEKPSSVCFYPTLSLSRYALRCNVLYLSSGRFRLHSICVAVRYKSPRLPVNCVLN
jgi:hypothetical protein